MPCQKKKKCHPQTCVNPSRRILDSLTISDIPQGRVVYLPCSLSPSPSTSEVCLCNDQCGPGACSSGKKPRASQAIKCQQQFTSKPSCARESVRTNGITIDDMPYCQELLRKLAQEAFAYDPDCADKRVCIQDPEDDMGGVDPSCCKLEQSLSKCPLTSKSTLKTPTRSCTTIAKKKICGGTSDTDVETIKIRCTNQMKTPSNISRPISRKSDGNCSLASCPRGVPSDKQLRSKPPVIAPIPCRKTSDTIASNSSQILLAQLAKKNCECGSKTSMKKVSCRCSKTSIEKVIEKAKKKCSRQSKINVVASKCSNKKCSVNTCPCRFPPAYRQYYDCTGQISGNCQCDRNN